MSKSIVTQLNECRKIIGMLEGKVAVAEAVNKGLEAQLEMATSCLAAFGAMQDQLDAKQAQIDSLMLEHAPGDMSVAQLEEWSKHQKVAEPQTDPDSQTANGRHPTVARIVAHLGAQGATFWEGVDDAIIGVAYRCGANSLVAYSRNRCIAIFESKGMTHEEAAEYVDYNLEGSWVSETTPVIIDERLAE